MLQGHRILKKAARNYVREIRAPTPLGARAALGAVGALGTLGALGALVAMDARGELGELGDLLGELDPHHSQKPTHDQITVAVTLGIVIIVDTNNILVPLISITKDPGSGRGGLPSPPLPRPPPPRPPPAQWQPSSAQARRQPLAHPACRFSPPVARQPRKRAAASGALPAAAATAWSSLALAVARPCGWC